jgi:ribonuclease Z
MVNMHVIFLGTSAATPTMTRGLSSLAIVRGGEVLLFDAGEGMQLNFIKSKIGMNKKMKIFITHMHADHCLGLLGLLQTLSLQGRENKIDIYGEPRLSEFITENIRIINFGLSYEVHLHIIESEGLVVKESDYEVTCCNATHSTSAFSYSLTEINRPGIFNILEAKRLGIPEGELYGRLQNGEDIIYNGKAIFSSQVVGPQRPGRKVGISGDTRPSEKLRKFFMNCDVLVFEATYSQKLERKALLNFHSTAKEAAEIAVGSRVKKLLLTHFSARYIDTQEILREAKSVYGNVSVAEDLMIVPVPYRE